VRGPDLNALSTRLQGMPGIEQTVAFGETMHVTGKDAVALEKSLRESIAGGAYTIAPADTGLEDVFIHLMQGAADNWDDREVRLK
jgi:ABC-2 type transport system ATP-binding protein